jgi:hypothetical protein
MRPTGQIPRQLPRLRSPFARAVVPVVAGIGFFALLFGVTWLIAQAVSGNNQGIRIGDREFFVGRADIAVSRIAEHGPLLFADLKGTQGERAIVVDHDAEAVDVEGWSVYFAYRADTGPSCLASISTDTQQLQDCGGRAITVHDLQPAEPDAVVVVELGKRPVVKVRFAAAVPTTTT